MPEALSAFADFIENELDLDSDEWGLLPVFSNDWPDREQRIAGARKQRAAAYTCPHVQVIDKPTFLIFYSVMLFIELLLLASRFA